MMQDQEQKHWDVIVIGTGIGGGALGRRLAEAGRSVLFLEKGPKGYRAERNGLGAATVTDPHARLLRGAWPDRMRAKIAGKEQYTFPVLGAGVGGSSVFYAAALERPEPHDLNHSEDRPHPTKGWPVSFDEMRPYYDAAQAMFEVRGEADPLSQHVSPKLAPPNEMSTGDAQLMRGMREAGLNPYQLHVAVRKLENCQSCFGHKCPRPCKMDGRSAGVEPALATGIAKLIDRCEVLSIEADRQRATKVVASRAGVHLSFTAEHVVLAAGALSSPRLLLQSQNAHWPQGIGNDHDLVGRYLMFHFNEIFALWPKRGEGYDEAAKSIGFRDIYFRNGERFGMVQSMGLNAGEGDILHVLRQRLERSVFKNVPMLDQLVRIPAAVAARMFGQAKIFVGLLEDLPYPENRVRCDPEQTDGILIEYTFPSELLRRRRKFRKAIRKALKGYRSFFTSFEPEPNLGHPCGSLRMGRSPSDSVLDKSCRVHGMDNLWIADASFMPTSTGVNPSLTIAANALRVADAILEQK